MARTNVDLKTKRRKKEEELTNRILMVFGFSLLALFVLMMLNRLIRTSGEGVGFKYLIPVSYGCLYASIGLTVAAVAGGVYAAVLWRRSPGHLWVGRLLHLCTITVLLAGAAALIYRMNYDAFPLLYVALIAVAFLYLVYNIYQRDFFVQALATGCAALTLYALSRVLGGAAIPAAAYAGYGAATALLVGALGLSYGLSRKKGMLGGVRLLPANANYKLMYFTYLALSAVLLLALLIGSAFSFWAMMGVLGYLFVLAVYYTIKLM